MKARTDLELITIDDKESRARAASSVDDENQAVYFEDDGSSDERW